ncbi:MAG: preprotein translocase subunit SecA, partial [Actinomycetia bacterium]|nr:preprotein translocase subunit SecA [Actinomycetes bacterium]
MPNILAKAFGFIEKKKMRKLEEVVGEVNSFEKEIASLDDDALKTKTSEFKKRLKEEESVDDILPETFAVVRETAKRLIKMRHFDVQILGGLVLHQGKIAEMKTGEGKTLVATLPVYLNSLLGKTVHLITVNDYLAKRDSEWMGPVYEFLGLKVGLLQNMMDQSLKKEAYQSDVIYGTNSEFG